MVWNRKIGYVVGSVAALAGASVVGSNGTAGASTRPAYEALAGSVAPFATPANAIADVRGASQLTIQLWLKPNLSGAQNFADAVSTPGSPLFHHYLSPNAYTDRFGPTSQQTTRVESWLRSEGFTAIQTDSQRNYVRATAAVSKIDAAFQVQLKLYRSTGSINAGPYELRANDRPIALPASLASTVVGITGLDNAAAILPLDRPTVKGVSTSAKAGVAPLKTPCSQYYGQNTVSGLPEEYGTTTFPTVSCGYSASQIRAAYGANTANIGTGQTVALVELGLAQDMFLTLKDYARANQMPAPNPANYSELSLGQGTACGDDFNVEEQLDVESSYDLAPGASQLVVGGDSCNNGDAGLQGLFDADTAILDGGANKPLATIASNSWEGGDESQPAVLTDIEHTYLLRAAAEGVGMYFSAGDGSGVETPSSDPFATAVGGTTLGIGKTNNRLFETGWSTGYSLLRAKSWALGPEQGASGGGPSVLWKEPKYQKGVVPAALAKAPGNRGGDIRSVPDISADADPFSGFLEGELIFNPAKPSQPPRFVQFDIGGTSLASPLVAGMVAAAQQGQRQAFGFINPLIYKLAGTTAFHDALPLTAQSPAAYHGTVCGKAVCGASLITTFDDQSVDMEGYTGQVTLQGYDNMTGVGTPAGQAFINALRKAA